MHNCFHNAPKHWRNHAHDEQEQPRPHKLKYSQNVFKHCPACTQHQLTNVSRPCADGRANYSAARPAGREALRACLYKALESAETTAAAQRIHRNRTVGPVSGGKAASNFETD